MSNINDDFQFILYDQLHNIIANFDVNIAVALSTNIKTALEQGYRIADDERRLLSELEFLIEHKKRGIKRKRTRREVSSSG